MLHELQGQLLGQRAYRELVKQFKEQRNLDVHYADHGQMRAVNFEYIEISYNCKRMHSAFHYKSRTQFLHDWIHRSPSPKNR